MTFHQEAGQGPHTFHAPAPLFRPHALHPSSVHKFDSGFFLESYFLSLSHAIQPPAATKRGG